VFFYAGSGPDYGQEGVVYNGPLVCVYVNKGTHVDVYEHNGTPCV